MGGTMVRNVSANPRDDADDADDDELDDKEDIDDTDAESENAEASEREDILSLLMRIVSLAYTHERQKKDNDFDAVADAAAWFDAATAAWIDADQTAGGF